MILIFCTCLVIFSACEDNQRKTKETSTVKRKHIPKDTSSPKQIVDSVLKKKPKFPILNEKSAMEFFLKYDKEHPENKVRVTTDFGEFEIELFEETKFHRSNFIYLTKRGYFNDTQFYRVVDNFIIQGGNTDDPEVKAKRKTIGKYLLPKDTQHGFKHHRGVVSMPSSEIANPHKLASPFEFFIVQKSDGAYHLDGDYTAFGRVTKGMEVVDKIAAQPTDKAEWPLHNIYIRKVEVID